jgi:hypothetical protein
MLSCDVLIVLMIFFMDEYFLTRNVLCILHNLSRIYSFSSSLLKIRIEEPVHGDIYIDVRKKIPGQDVPSSIRPPIWADNTLNESFPCYMENGSCEAEFIRRPFM